jgi:hypothetical protein
MGSQTLLGVPRGYSDFWKSRCPQISVKIVGPHLGNKPIAAIEAPDLLAELRKLEKRGVNDTAHRVRAVRGRVFRYAIATGRAKHDISGDLKGARSERHNQLSPSLTLAR